jgi:hypothetical protein
MVLSGSSLDPAARIVEWSDRGEHSDALPQGLGYAWASIAKLRREGAIA